MMKKRLFRVMLFGVVGLTLLCIAILGISAASNLNLPLHSQVTDRLPDLEKARLAEATHLRRSLGDTVWPGWGVEEIPIIVYNEEYAFLVGYPDPPTGWVRMPQNEPRGGPWEAVPDDTFEGQVYYRQRLPDPEITPENFTVLVGERWAATIQTKEYAEIEFYAGFREEIPPALRSIFPYRLAWVCSWARWIPISASLSTRPSMRSREAWYLLAWMRLKRLIRARVSIPGTILPSRTPGTRKWTC